MKCLYLSWLAVIIVYRMPYRNVWRFVILLFEHHHHYGSNRYRVHINCVQRQFSIYVDNNSIQNGMGPPKC